MAAPPSDTPKIGVDRLKGGEINWTRTRPDTGADPIAKALADAKRLIVGCLDLEDFEREERARRKALAAARADSLKETGQ